MTAPILSREALFQMAVKEKEYTVIKSAMAKANDYVGRNLTFDEAFKVSRCISKDAYAVFKRDLLAQYPSKEYSSDLEFAFFTKKMLLLGTLQDRIFEVILPQKADSPKDLKDCTFEVIPTETPNSSL